jgi:NHL repeat
VLSLPNPRSVIALPTGDVLVAAGSDGARYSSPVSALQSIDPNGTVTTFAGQSAPFQFGNVGGPAASARFWRPQQLALGTGGRVLVADAGNHAIRQVDAAGNVSTIAGGAGNGYVDASGGAARFSRTTSLAAMPDGSLRVADGTNAVVRTVTAAGAASTTPLDLRLNVSGGPAPTRIPSVAASPEGTLYVGRVFGTSSDFGQSDPNGRVVTIATPRADGFNSAMAAGPGGSFYFQAFNGIFRKPPGADAVPLYALGNGSPILRMAIDAAATVYFTSSNDNAVHAVTAAGEHRVLAGDPAGAGRADGAGTAARFNRPYALAADAFGNVYVSDVATVRRIGPDGQVTTLIDLASTPIAPVLVQFGDAPSAVQGLAWSNGFLYLGLAGQNAVMKYGPMP